MLKILVIHRYHNSALTENRYLRKQETDLHPCHMSISFITVYRINYFKPFETKNEPQTSTHKQQESGL